MEQWLSGPAGTWVAATLTLMVFSFLLGDNPLYRLAEHLLLGATVAYAVVVAVQQVLIPRLLDPLARDPSNNWVLSVPLMLGLLLLSKVRASSAWVGNSAVAFILGVGVALAIGGALSSSLVPQVQASLLSLSPEEAGGNVGLLRNLTLLLGTVGSLAYFYFTVDGRRLALRGRAALRNFWWAIGRWAIMITLGALFANGLVSRLTLLIDRFQFLLGDWLQLL